MKYVSSCMIALLIFISVNSIAQTVRFTIEGHTFHKTGKARLLLYTNRSQFIPFDSADIKDGYFFITDTLDEPKLFSLQYAGEERKLFAGNEHIIITEKDSFTRQITVIGSALTNDYDNYTARWITPLQDHLQSLDQIIAGLDATHQPEIDSLQAIRSSLFNHVPDSTATFIREHPASFVSLYFLNYYSNSYNIIQKHFLYSLLNNKLKEYPSADSLTQKIAFGLHESAKCPQFSIPDSNHQLITLQSFKGNYLFIDFWASWCVPCLKNIPYVQKAAAQFHDNNFKVLTASLDNNPSTWKQALEQYHLTEISKNVLLNNTFRNPMALQFNVSYLPTNVLVDPEGNIIARNMDGERLTQKLTEIFASIKQK